MAANNAIRIYYWSSNVICGNNAKKISPNMKPVMSSISKYLRELRNYQLQHTIYKVKDEEL